MKAKLVLTSKDRQTVQEVPFDRPNITIGRKPTNDLAFNRPEISGSHAAFLFENNDYFVMDLGSTNGTLLNGAQLVAREKYGLQDKDVVTISPYTIQFIIEDESMDTMIEVPAQPSMGVKRVSSGTAPDLAPAADAARSKEAPPPAKKNAEPAPAPAVAEAEPQVPPPPAPTPAPAAAAPVPAAAAPARPAQPVVVPDVPSKAPSAFTDYIWLGIGAILLLAAIGMIVFIFMGL
jgi:pSer/pThr/pTyr-binding forkhead associated (FHA) protein